MKSATSCAPIAHDHDGPIDLVPEIMLPAQFADLRRSGVVRCPERRLMLAVLEDAVHLYQVGVAGGGSARRLYGESERWLTSDDTSSPFSFIRICEALGLEAEYVRSGLRRWRIRRESDPTGLLPMPRQRHVSGSRHRLTMRRTHHGPRAGAADQ